jgi:hypothetical protein
MTLSIDGTNIGEIIEIASIVGSIVATAIVGLIVYLMVRPPRHVRDQRRTGRIVERHDERHGPAEEEDLLEVIDRMEARIETLERLLADRDERPALRRRDQDQDQDLTPADGGRETGRK